MSTGTAIIVAAIIAADRDYRNRMTLQDDRHAGVGALHLVCFWRRRDRKARFDIRALARRATREDHEREKLALLTNPEEEPQRPAAGLQVRQRSVRRRDR
jgi:hypothetical protein